MVGNFAAMANEKKFRRVYLSDWRTHAGLTQDELGEKMGVTGMAISRWERGVRDIDTETLTKLASALSKAIQMPLEPQDLFRHPKTLSLDSMLRGAPEALKRQAAAFIRVIKEDGGQK